MDYPALRTRLQELTERKWDLATIEARYAAAMAKGFRGKTLRRSETQADVPRILDRVQQRAEEYNVFAGNCARGTALALMEEFGLGGPQVLKALSPFPGCGGMGWMCGGVTGALAALGLFAGSEDLRDRDAMQKTMSAARQFMERFEKEVGALTCRRLQEDVVFGRYMDPGASPENMRAFEDARGFERCSLLPGIGARIAAEIILEGLEA